MKKSLLVWLLVLAFPPQVKAVCPVCTVAVAGGLGLSRWLGIDDTVTSVWIGGLIISMGLWLADWLGKKKWPIPYQKYREYWSVVMMFLLVMVPLYVTGSIGVARNTWWGVDKVVLGTLIGNGLFLIGYGLDKWLRTTNQGKVYIYYQKVIAPVSLLLIGSLALYFITR